MGSLYTRDYIETGEHTMSDKGVEFEIVESVVDVDQLLDMMELAYRDPATRQRVIEVLGRHPSLTEAFGEIYKEATEEKK